LTFVLWIITYGEDSGRKEFWELKQLRKKSMLVWMGLALYSLAGFTGLNNSVLCIGSDGHVMIEFSIHDLCCEAAIFAFGKNASSPVPVETAGEHCGPCVDIPLTAGHTENHITNSRNSFEKDVLSCAVTVNEIDVQKSSPFHSILPSGQPPDLEDPLTRIIQTVHLIV
jgi:hypothetical protein